MFSAEPHLEYVVRTRLARLLSCRLDLQDVVLDGPEGEVSLAGNWSGPDGPRAVRGRARLSRGPRADERALLLALARAVAALATASGLGMGVLRRR